jgi:hypothetical protein
VGVRARLVRPVARPEDGEVTLGRRVKQKRAAEAALFRVPTLYGKPKRKSRQETAESLGFSGIPNLYVYTIRLV